MLRVTAMTSWQSFRWLWRFDSEAKWFWLYCFITLKPGESLREDVEINLRDFGV